MALKGVCFSSATGGGHDAAARALAQALNSLDVSAQCVDILRFAGRKTADAVEGAYMSIARSHPRFFGKLYRAGSRISTPKRKSPVYYANLLYGRALRDYLQSERPDLIVCSHIFAAQALTGLRGKVSLPPIGGIVTDYTCAPFWEEVHLDVYFTPHPSLHSEFSAHGVDAQLLLPTGIPVSPDCVPCVDQKAAKQAQGIPATARHVLLAGGSMGAGNLPEITRELLTLPEDVFITVVCGNNLAAQEALAQDASRSAGRLRVFGRVFPLFDLMDASDVILTKPGGLTSTEVMTKRIPLICVTPIEGVETANAAFFERTGAALYARRPGDARYYALKLLTDPSSVEAMARAQAQIASGHAALDAARAMISLAQKRGDA